MSIPIDIYIEVGEQPSDVRCPGCHKLLNKIISSDGNTVISSKCRCGMMVEIHVSRAPVAHRAAGREFKGAR